MTDTTTLIAEARRELAAMATAATSVAATLDEAEQRIAELEGTIRQSAESALAVANGKSEKPRSAAGADFNPVRSKAERKPRQTRQRQPRGAAQQKVREAIASMQGPWSAKDIEKFTGESAYRHIRQFKEEGLVREIEHEGSTKFYETVREADIEGNGAGDEAQVAAIA